MTHAQSDKAAIASEVLAALDSAKQIAPFSGRAGGLELPASYAVTAELRRLRQARGEKTVGRKIGFTNRAMWAEYGVGAPIWGDMYEHTVLDIAAIGGVFDVSLLLEPKIEPEIAFGIAKPPRPDMDEAALLGCIDWVAHGFEIVQSVYPGWKFSAADGVAGGCLHGAFLMGAKHRLEDTAPALLQALPKFQVEISRNGEVLDHGVGANVLDSPLSALRHLVTLLASDTSNPPLAAGEIVTTGTLTRAFGIAPGETWATKITGLPVAGISVSFV
jgi:2-oxo-3-hexenedioate decarboxylase